MKSISGKTSSQTIGWMAWSGASRFIVMLVSIGSVAILARLLTVEDYGIFAAAMIFIGIVRSGLVQAGFPSAVIQRPDLTAMHVRNAFTGMLLIHLAAAALLWFGTGTIADFFAMPQLVDILRVLCITVLLNPLLAISMALLKRRKRFRALALINTFVSIIANTAVAVALAWAGYGVWALIVATITSTVAQTLITFSLARYSVVPAITSHMRDLLKMSLGMTLFGGLAMLSMQAANFVIGRLLGADALGVYNRARRVLDFPRDMVGSSHVLFPVMADMSHDRERMARGYLRSVALCMLAGVPLTVLVCHGAEYLILLLLGPRWTAAVEPTAILALALAFGMVNQVTMAVFMALAKVEALILRQFVYAVLVISLALIGSRWGLAGVCVGVVASSLVNYIVSIHLANRLLDVGWSRFAKVNLPALALAVPVLAVLVLGEILVWRDAPTLLKFPIEAAAAGAVVYGASFVKPAWFLGPNGVWLVNEMRRRMPTRLRGLLPKLAD